MCPRNSLKAQHTARHQLFLQLAKRLVSALRAGHLPAVAGAGSIKARARTSLEEEEIYSDFQPRPMNWALLSPKNCDPGRHFQALSTPVNGGHDRNPKILF